MRAAEDISLLGRLSLGQKLALVVAAMAVPAIVLGCFYLQQAAASVRQARSELEGTRYMQELEAVSAEVLRHRSREYALLNGDKARREDVVAAEAEADRLIEAADRIGAELGEKFVVSQAWQSVKTDWATLKANGMQQSPEDNDAAHAALGDRLRRMVEEISSRSMTSVDPERSTRALLRVASGYAPDLLLYSASVRRHAVRAAAKGYLGGDDRMGIRLFRERQQVALQNLQSSLEQVTAAVRGPITESVAAAQTAADEYFSTIQAKILNASNMEASIGAVYDAGMATDRALEKVTLVSYATLTKAVDERLSRANEYRAITGTCVALALGLALALSVLITRSLSRPLRHAVKVFGRIAAGNYENSVTVIGTDEGSRVLSALDKMQGLLRTQIESERAMAAENSRIRQALDKASTNVLLADALHRIIYLNETAQTTFARNQTEICTSLPGFDARALPGTSLEALCTDPGRERRMLDSMSGSEVHERVLGALTFRIVSSPVLGEKGERIGTVVEWTDRTQEIAVEKEMQTMLSSVNDGDLVSRISVAGKTGFFAAASRGINQLADNMAEVVAQVKDAAAEVYRSSKEIASGNVNLQQRTEEQSASLEETASSMEQMTTTVRQNADNAGEANQLAVAARDQAEHGGTVVSKAVHAMSDINESARKIADIIGVIDEIAFQTNLLALNAAVEAARAGEQGRGFAVVATEVRTLAGRSATAAKEIKELIQDSVKKVEDGSLYVTRSGQTLEQIVASVKKVSDIVAEIAAASREQSAGIGQVSSAVLQMDELTQQNAALVEQVTTASQAMAHEAHALHGLMGSYRLGDLVRPSLATHVRAAGTAVDSRRAAAAAPQADSRNEQPSRVARRSAPRTSSRAVERAQPAAAAVEDDGEWQEF